MDYKIACVLCSSQKLKIPKLTMEDYLHVYDNPEQQRKGYQKDSCVSEGEMYLAPLKSHQEKKNEYEKPQISALSLPKMRPPVYECAINPHQNDPTDPGARGIQRELSKTKKKPVWLITACVLMTVFAVLSLIALAIGALSYTATQSNGSSSAQIGTGPMSGAVSGESLNNTYLLNEIRTLNILIGQLNLETQRNISQLSSQLSDSFSLTNDNISSMNVIQSNLMSDISTAQTSIGSVNRQLSIAKGDIVLVKHTVTQKISSLINTNIRSVGRSVSSLISTNIPSVSNQFGNSANSLNARINSVSDSLSADIYTASTSLTKKILSTSNSLHQRIVATNVALNARISTESVRLSMVSASVTNWLRNPYQNCHEDKRSCQINQLTDYGRRLFCSTRTLVVNITVSLLIIFVTVGLIGLLSCTINNYFRIFIPLICGVKLVVDLYIWKLPAYRNDLQIL